MATTVVRFDIYDGAFVTMIAPGGDANKYVTRQMRAMKLAAEALAPVGAPRIGEAHALGNLKYSHGTTGVLMQGRLQATGTLYNSAPYALYVHQGTTGPIRPRRARALSIPRSSFAYYTGIGMNDGLRVDASPRAVTHLLWFNYRKRKARSVKGQRANPWIERAVDLVMR